MPLTAMQIAELPAAAAASTHLYGLSGKAGSQSVNPDCCLQVDLDLLRELAWSGIPADLRPTCWQLLLGYAPPNRERRWGLHPAMYICTLQRRSSIPSAGDFMLLRTCMLHQYMSLTAGQPMPLLGCQVLLCLQLPGRLSAWASSSLHSHGCNG